MKKKLIQILANLVQLLEVCSRTSEAEWIDERRKLLNSHTIKSDNFQNTLKEIVDNLVGMGSISDIPVYPADSSRMTPSEASFILWDIVEKIGEFANGLKQ